MKSLDFEALARLPAVEAYQRDFRTATGVTLRLVPPQGDTPAVSVSCADNPFCALVSSLPSGCAACVQTARRARGLVAGKVVGQQLHCYAGLSLFVAPVWAACQQVATLVAGQVFRREPTERDFLLVLKMLGPARSEDWVRKARKAYFETPVLTAERFQAVVQLVEVFARYLGDFASRQAIASSPVEPQPVANAKEFVQAHVEQPITLSQVVEHVHVSRFYFCKLFKKATGMTLTDYVCRVRVERAKTLLSDPSRRISEVVFASGFGSIPQFNNVFKRLVGMPPSEYRAGLRLRLRD